MARKILQIRVWPFEHMVGYISHYPRANESENIDHRSRKVNNVSDSPERNKTARGEPGKIDAATNSESILVSLQTKTCVRVKTPV